MQSKVKIRRFSLWKDCRTSANILRVSHRCYRWFYWGSGQFGVSKKATFSQTETWIYSSTIHHIGWKHRGKYASFRHNGENTRKHAEGNVPVPLNWLLASVIVLFLPFATGGENIYKRRKTQWVTKEKTAHFFSILLIITSHRRVTCHWNRCKILPLPPV